MAAVLGSTGGDGVQDCTLLLPGDICVADDLQLLALYATGHRQPHPGARGR